RTDDIPSTNAVVITAPVPRARMKGPPRPSFQEAAHFDYSDLPLLTPIALGSSDRESFWLVVIDKTSKNCAPGEPRQKLTWRFSKKWPADTVIRIDDFLLPPLSSLDGDYEDDTLYYSLIAKPYDSSRVATHISLVAPAEWTIIDRSGPNSDVVPVAHYEG